MAALDRWRALPEPARWALAYAATAALAALLGWLSPFGVGNAVFLAGALAILASVTQVGLGGPRTKVVARTLQGRPIRGPMPADERRRQIRRGVKLLLFGLALWAPLLLAVVARPSG